MTAQFLKLTEVYQNGDTLALIINVSNVLSVKRSDRGKDTHIQMKDMKYFFVKETVEQVWEKLNIDYSRAPIMMNAVEALKYHDLKGAA